MQELRFIKATELRASKDGKQIFGYAATFNVNAQLPGFQECIRSGAFTRAIKNKQDVVCLFNHDANYPLGRTTSGTLRLKQDDKGLYYTCDIPDTSYGRDLHTLISNGTINGCSFAFKMVDNGQRWSEGKAADGSFVVQREILDCDLLDVSTVTYPAYSGTQVDARATEVPAEIRSRVDALNFGRQIGAGTPTVKSYHLPKFSRAIRGPKQFNAENGTRMSLGQMHDVLDEIKRKRQALLDAVLD